MLSNLSNIPPCPGNIFPVSLTPTLRFIADIVMSPKNPNIASVADTMTISVMLNGVNPLIARPKPVEHIIPPIKPS